MAKYDEFTVSSPSGADVQVHMDMRSAVGKIRWYCTEKITKSVRDPEVRYEIYNEMLDILKRDIPVDTGALSDSPAAGNAGMNYGVSRKYPKYFKGTHYAHGAYTDKGLIFDPIYKEPGEEPVHYATFVEKFDPMQSLSNGLNKAELYYRIKDIITKQV